MPKELLSFLPEYIPLGIVVYDRDGYLKYANGIALAMFGVTMKEVLDINIFDDPNITGRDKEALRRDEDVSFETDYDFDLCGERFFDTGIRGIRKYFVTRVNILRDKEGNRRGYVLTCEDITQKKAQQEKIASIQKELALALDAGKLTSWNYLVDEEVFYKFSETIDRIERRTLASICESIHPDDRERFTGLLERIIRKEPQPDNHFVLKTWLEEYRNYRYCDFLYSARENEQGQVALITFVQRDITEEMQFRQRLIAAKEKAEEADRLKSTFLANMSHEIRTPLNAIVGFSELLSDATDPAEKSEYKQLIETNSEILLKLIGDILDLSKIEAGSIDIKREKFDVGQLCNDLYRSFRQRLTDDRVTLRLVDPYARCTAVFDKHRFIQIYSNFVANAIKYTPSGEIVMGYECAPGQVKIYVRDTGIGIAEEKKHRIFSRFEKLDTFAQGTGLGLSICKAIADATGGKVGFESTQHVGSEFWYIGYTDVEYVEKTQTDAGEAQATSAEDDAAALPDKLSNLRILVAEDNDSNFLLLRNLLKECSLTRALTGAEAVEKLRKEPFDLVFMDMRMPVMDGLEATRRIRAFDAATPVIALTANAFDSDKENAMAAGCNFFLSKPVKKRELTELLARYCK